MCAKLGSDWFRNLNLYKVRTNKQTHTHTQTNKQKRKEIFRFVYKITTEIQRGYLT